MTMDGEKFPIEQASELRKSVGLPKSIVRINLLQCLASQSCPRSQAEIPEQLSSHGFDDSTIFRVLTDLTESNLVVRIDPGDRIWRFELHDRDPGGQLTSPHHSHAFCTQCGSVVCLPALLVEEFYNAMSGWSVSDAFLRGVCERCGGLN